MALLESIRVALEAIWANKLRALLTMLGVIIGVSSVIIMISIVQGLRQKIISQLSSNGANLIFAGYAPRPDSASRGGVHGITLADIAAIQRRCTLVSTVSPAAETAGTARFGRHAKSITLIGVLPDYAQTYNCPVALGRFVAQDDLDKFGRACVIGTKVRSDLFGASDPVGQDVLADVNGTTVSLTVVGMLIHKDRGDGGQDFDDSMLMPLTSMQKRVTGSDLLNDFAATSYNVAETELAADQIWGVLKERHPLNYRDYIVDTQEGLLKQIDTIIGVLQIALGGIAGLSLLTGGIGIMNIMLVSVTERTREIGIRKAVGATRGAILTQFVVEAVVVSGVGGLIGIGIGYGVAAIIDHFAHDNLPAFVPLWAVGLGFGFAAGVGLFFGIYPAFRASKLDPIQALRYE